MASGSTVTIQALLDTSDVEQGVNKMSNSFQSLNTGATVAASAVLAGIVALGGAAMAAAQELDVGYDTIITKTGATGDALDDLKEQMNDLFGSMNISAEDAGIAIGEVNTRFGLTGDALEDVSATFLKFADINGTDLNTAIDSVDSIMQKFGVDADQVGNVLGLMTATAQDTGITIDTLESSLTKNGASLDAMGFSLEDSISLLGMMESSGIDVSTAMTSMKTAVKNATKEGQSADEALAEMIDSIKGAETDTEALSLATELFGSKAAPEMASAIRDGRFSLEELGVSIEDYGTVVNDTYEATQNPWDKMAIALNDLKLAGSEIGTVLWEAFEPAIDIIVQLAQGIADFVSQNPELVVTVLGGIAAALAGFLAVQGVTAIISGIAGALSALAASPMVLIVSLIAGAVAALVWFFTQTETGQAILQAFVDFITTAFQAVWDFLVTCWEGITTAVTTAIDTVSEVVTTVVSAISSFWSSIWNAIASVLKSVWNTISSTVSSVISTVSSVISGALGTIKSVWTSAWNSVKTTLTNAWNSIKNGVQTGISSVVSFVSGLPGKILSALGNVGTLLYKAGKSIIDGLLNGIKAAVSGVYNFVSGIAGTILSLKGPEEYDKKLLIPAGEWIMDSLVTGLDSGEAGLVDKLKSITSLVADTSFDKFDVGINTASAMDITGSVISADSAEDNSTTKILSKLDEVVEGLQDIADLNLVFNVSDKTLAKAIASASDKVSGVRQTFALRGLAL